jgi:hypothetical protein
MAKFGFSYIRLKFKTAHLYVLYFMNLDNGWQFSPNFTTDQFLFGYDGLNWIPKTTLRVATIVYECLNFFYNFG